MQNFYRLAEKADVVAAMHETMRLQHSFHGDQIVFRANDEWTPNAGPKSATIIRLAMEVFKAVNGTRIDSVVIVRVPAGAKLSCGGGHFACLHAAPGFMVLSGDETVQIETGSVWWINPSLEALAINNSKDDVILLLIGIGVD